MVKCQVVMEALEKIAPRHLAEEWDNVGLLVGSPAQEVHKIIVALDVSETLVDFAVTEKYDMIISHHPLLFKPMKQLRTDLPQGRVLQKLLAAKIAVFAAHTNLDIADGGVNDVLAKLLGLKNIRPFAVTAEEELVKLVVFVPAEQADVVQKALGDAGAGHIGNYSHCAFRCQGQGTFLPLAKANPFIGKPGVLEQVEEVRLETIFPERSQNRIVRAMCKAHPYEEPAYDLYPLKNKGNVMSLGRMADLETALPVETFSHKVKLALAADTVRLVRGGEKMVSRVALCSGSGAEFIAKAAYMGADAYVTGDVKYHEAQRAAELGLHLIDAGHFATETPVVPVLAEKLKAIAAAGKWKVEISADTTGTDPFEFI